MPGMDDLLIARLIAAGRVLFGALCVGAPKLLLRRDAASTPGPAVWMLRAFGVRDVALGAGTLSALRDDPPDTRWVAVSAAADSADIATAAAFRDELGVGGLIATLALAVPAAALGWKSVAGLRSLR
jgi:hypothetical protein